MTNFDMTWYWYWGDRIFGGNRFFGASMYSRINNAENEILLRSACTIDEFRMEFFENTVNQPLDIHLVKNGVDVPNVVWEWLALETGVKFPNLATVDFAQDDTMNFRMTGPSNFGGPIINMICKARVRFLPRI